MIGLALKALPEPLKLGAAFVLGCIVTAPLAQCQGQRTERAAQQSRQSRADAAATRIARAADALLAQRKSASEQTFSTQRQELDNATAQLPDQNLSDRQRIRACIELRRSGQIVTPAACRPLR